MPQSYIIEVSSQAAGIVVRNPEGFVFFAASHRFNRLDGQLFEHRTAMDTLVLYPSQRAFEMTWRTAIPVPRRSRRLEDIQVHEKRVL